MTCVSTRTYFEYIAICNAWVCILGGRNSPAQNWYLSKDDQGSLAMYANNIGYLLMALHREVIVSRKV